MATVCSPCDIFLGSGSPRPVLGLLFGSCSLHWTCFGYISLLTPHFLSYLWPRHFPCSFLVLFRFALRNMTFLSRLSFAPLFSSPHLNWPSLIPILHSFYRPLLAVLSLAHVLISRSPLSPLCSHTRSPSVAIGSLSSRLHKKVPITQNISIITQTRNPEEKKRKKEEKNPAIKNPYERYRWKKETIETPTTNNTLFFFPCQYTPLLIFLLLFLLFT